MRDWLIYIISLAVALAIAIREIYKWKQQGEKEHWLLLIALLIASVGPVAQKFLSTPPPKPAEYVPYQFADTAMARQFGCTPREWEQNKIQQSVLQKQLEEERTRRSAAEAQRDSVCFVLYRDAAKSVLALAFVAAEEKNYDSSIVLFRKAKEAHNATDEDKITAWHFLGVNYSNLGETRKAIVAYDSCIRIAPSFIPARNNRAFLLGETGQLDEAELELKKIVKMAPNFGTGWVNLGACLGEQGKYEEALSCYYRALQYSNSAHIWNNVGCALSSLGFQCEALEGFDRAINEDNNERLAWYSRGNCLVELGRLEDAVLSFNVAIEIAPGIGSAWRDRGIAQKKLGAYGEALASIDSAIAKDRSKAEYWTSRGDLLNKVGRNEEAIRAYDCAIIYGSKDPMVWNNKGTLLSNMKRCIEAGQNIDSALNIDPTSQYFWVNRGVVALQCDQNEWAKTCFEAAISLGDASRETEIYYGTTQLLMNNPEAALTSFGKALEQIPNDLYANEAYGFALIMSGFQCEALRVADIVLARDPSLESALRVREAALAFNAIDNGSSTSEEEDWVEIEGLVVGWMGKQMILKLPPISSDISTEDSAP